MKSRHPNTQILIAPRAAQPAASCPGDGLKSAALTAYVRGGIKTLLRIYGEEAVEVLKKEIRGGGRREAPAWWYEDC